jgi:hypothetical protein
VGFAAEIRDIARPLIASFQRSARPAQGKPDIMLLSGARGWTDRARECVDQGLKRILVVEPAAEEPAQVRALDKICANGGATVLLSEGYAHNPAVPGFAQWLNAGRDLVMLHGTGPEPVSDLLLMQVRLLRAIGVVNLVAHDCVSTSESILLSGVGEIGAHPHEVRIMATQTRGSGRMSIRVDAPLSAARLELGDGWTARPAIASIATADGLTTLPTIYESAHRARLRTLVSGVAPGDAQSLIQFASDVEFARRD